MAITIQQTGAYVSQMAFRLPDSLDIERFCQAWQLVVDLNPILRTRFFYSDLAGSLQVVVQDEIFWRSADNSLASYLKIDKSTPVVHGQQLARFALVHDPSLGRHFVFTAHHGIYDGWTVSKIFEQVAKAYEQQEIAESVPFTRFISYLGDVGSDSVASENFWKAQLGGGCPVSFPQLPYPSYQPRPDQVHHHSMDIAQVAKSDITTSTMLQAAWSLVISRYTDSDDILFGATLSGRNAAIKGIEHITGPTITTVPVRVRLDRDQSIATYLQSIQDQATAMIPFEHTGLQNIRRIQGIAQEALDFKHLFAVQPIGRSDDQHTIMGLEAVPIETGAFETYSLILECKVSNKIDVVSRYDGAIFAAEQIRRLLQQFDYAFQTLSTGSGTRTLRDVAIFSQQDQQQVFEWNSHEPEVVDACVHEVFHNQVRLQPDMPAVCAWDGDFTYRELDTLSTRLAHYLIEIGSGPEKIIPLCFDKSAWAVVAMLAVMKTGAACVNLGPTHPVARLKFVIHECKANFILAAPQHAHLFDNVVQNVVVLKPTLFEESLTNASAMLPLVPPTSAGFYSFYFWHNRQAKRHCPRAPLSLLKRSGTWFYMAHWSRDESATVCRLHFRRKCH